MSGIEKLSEYRKKRKFNVTPEPQGGPAGRKRAAKRLVYAVQKHMATNLHYDLRLEWDGVLLSWAVPKGPSLDPAVKRLAMRTEDHPLEYANFEGVIPAGEYGAGTVMVWDKGSWMPDDPDVDGSLAHGEIKFSIEGEKLRGSWVLVRTRGFGSSPSRSSWLWIKHRDEYASTEDVELDEPRSAKSGRLLKEIARVNGGDVGRAAEGDPLKAGNRGTRERGNKKARSKGVRVRGSKSASRRVSKPASPRRARPKK